jgi:enoyl-CoA hydratase/carnithine racemase
MTDEIRIEVSGPVLTLTIARPQKKNALTAAMYERLIEGLDRAERTAEIAAVVITGSGGVFTAGNDMADFLAAAESGGAGAQGMAAFRFIRRLAAFDKPMIAAVEGLAIGIGATLCLHCDLVYAAPGAQFLMPFVKIGIVPEGAASLIVPRRFGLARATEMLLLGEGFSAEKAHEIGFANAVVPAERLLPLAYERAQVFATQPREALLAARRLIRGDREEILRRIDEEGGLIARFLATPETKATFQAFLARGKG